MNKTHVVSDSSFIMCFIDDIGNSLCLNGFLERPNLSFVIGEIILAEVAKSPNYFLFEKMCKPNLTIFDYYAYGEILRPFFSIDEMEKGEHEAMVISYIFYFKNENMLAIMDDNSPKEMFKARFPHLSNQVIGTIGFIEKCTCKCKFLSKREGIDLLVEIKKSKFWVRDRIVDDAIQRIGEC